MSPQIERPADDGGSVHQSGQRSDNTDCNNPVVCRIDPTRDCHHVDVVRHWNADYCPPCATEYVAKLRRRVNRRDAGVDPDSPVGIGVPQSPATDWAPSFYLLQCDMCPRTWVGQSWEVCPTCRQWWIDAAKVHDKSIGERRGRR